MYSFNRLCLDHCLTTDRVQEFRLTKTELNAADVYELQGLTV